MGSNCNTVCPNQTLCDAIKSIFFPCNFYPNLPRHVTISDMEFYFRNFYFFFFLRRRGRNNIQNMTVIFSGNDYVLYSMLKVSNVCLNIILREVYSQSESNNRYLPQILKIKQTYVKTVNSLRTNIHNKDGITHSLTVQSIHIWIIYFPCPLFFTSHLPCFCCHIVSTLDATKHW